MIYGVILLSVGMSLMFVMPVINVFSGFDMSFQLYDYLSNETIGGGICVIGLISIIRKIKTQNIQLLNN